MPHPERACSWTTNARTSRRRAGSGCMPFTLTTRTPLWTRSIAPWPQMVQAVETRTIRCSMARRRLVEVLRVGDLELGSDSLAQDVEDLGTAVVEAAVADGGRKLGLVGHAQPGQGGGVGLGLVRTELELPLAPPQRV